MTTTFVMLSGGPRDGEEIQVDRQSLSAPDLEVPLLDKPVLTFRPGEAPLTPTAPSRALYRRWYSSHDGTRMVYSFVEEL